VAAAGARTISLSIVRDVHAGRQMARTMSLVMMVFMAVPMLAPNIGQLVLLVASWRWIFVVLGMCGLAVAGWVAWRLEETLPADQRRPLDIKSLASGYWLVFKTRVTCGYMLALGSVFGALFAYISSSEQLYRDVFDKQESFALYFASVAGAMAISAFLNSRLVERLGMRPLAHGALLAFTIVNVIHVLLARQGMIGFAGFHGLMMLSFFAFAFIGANFNAIAMEPLGKIAGTASAAIGFSSTLIAGALGAVVGQQFDGTTTPVITGFAGLGAISLLILAITERGRLFTAGEPS
jgi:DHA1 family bicyclomycin/chloramphenicol resistance-like MFS transporter